jgi:acid phosphatase
MSMKQLSLLLLAVAGCYDTSGSTNDTCAALTQGSASPPSAWTGSVFTVVMENKSRGDIVGNKKAPYINSLIKQGALLSGYHDSYVHPSEPNYLWMVAGQNFGILDDDDPKKHSIDSSSHLADQLELAGITWKAYQESMGDPCGLTSHGRYAAKHNPFVYFDDINGWDGTKFQTSQRCIEHVVDYSQLDADIAAKALPKYAFITPNLDNDMHDGSITQGDTWLYQNLSQYAAWARANNSLLILTWDEDDNTPRNQIPTVFYGANVRPGIYNEPISHYNVLSTLEEMYGLPKLGYATRAPAITDIWGA